MFTSNRPSSNLKPWLCGVIPGAFWHLGGVNSSPREAVWLAVTLDLPRLPTQHSPNHSDSQMASNRAFQLPPRAGQAIAQLSARHDGRGRGERAPAGHSCIPNLGNAGTLLGISTLLQVFPNCVMCVIIVTEKTGASSTGDITKLCRVFVPYVYKAGCPQLPLVARS